MPVYLQYYFWLLVVSGTMFLLERRFAARPEQEILRPGFVQDLFWMLFNTQYLSWMLALVTVHTVAWFNTSFVHLGLSSPDSVQLIADWPWWAQFLAVLVLKDFLEWNLHRWLHRIPALWRWHQLHHSIEHLDWAATFRVHWGEVILYKIFLYLPLVVLGADSSVVFAIVLISLVTQELTHANLPWDWGPLRYVFSSPRYHAWHHDREMHGPGGQNFGVMLTVWDWLFRTAYYPHRAAAPTACGLPAESRYPQDVWRRFWAPFRRSPALDRLQDILPQRLKKETAAGGSPTAAAKAKGSSFNVSDS